MDFSTIDGSGVFKNISVRGNFEGNNSEYKGVLVPLEEFKLEAKNHFGFNSKSSGLGVIAPLSTLVGSGVGKVGI